MSEGHNTLRVDLENLEKSNFQKQLHLPRDTEEDMISQFHRTFIKVLFSAQVPQVLKRTEEGAGAYVYHANPKFDFLKYIYMRTPLPAIEVKEKWVKTVQICWPHNIGHNISTKTTHCFDDNPVQSFDPISLDISSQFFARSGAGKRTASKVNIGAIGLLEKWNSSLPRWVLNVNLPFSHGKHNTQATPLFMCSKSRVTYKSEFRLQIIELLRMRVRDDPDKNKKWKWTELDKVTTGYLNTEANIPIPQIWGRYAKITDAEKAAWMESPKSYYIEDMPAFQAQNKYKYGEDAKVLLSTTDPVKAILWVAQSVQAVKTRNFSNYTTNNKDHKKGWNPIMSFGLKYGSIVRVPDMPIDHFSRAEPSNQFPSAPDEEGYAGYAISDNPNNFRSAESGVTMPADLQCTAYFKIGDTNPFNFKTTDPLIAQKLDDDQDNTPLELRRHRHHRGNGSNGGNGSDGGGDDDDGGASSSKPYDEEDDDDNKFEVHVRLLTMKKITFNNASDDGEIGKGVITTSTSRDTMSPAYN